MATNDESQVIVAKGFWDDRANPISVGLERPEFTPVERPKGVSLKQEALPSVEWSSSAVHEITWEPRNLSGLLCALVWLAGR
jgi:hypothetical protein